MSIHITPAMNAVWAYAEWCCNNRKPWPKMAVVAADLARDECNVRIAFDTLERLGVLSRVNSGRIQSVVRLGDGRQTAPLPHVIHNIHRPPRHCEPRRDAVRGMSPATFRRAA